MTSLCAPQRPPLYAVDGTPLAQLTFEQVSFPGCPYVAYAGGVEVWITHQNGRRALLWWGDDEQPTEHPTVVEAMKAADRRLNA